ncbi:MAG: hypothetical protein JF586_14140 [Burkholderiales bacterium]|nr:hypothetical protein [Burkholderiales bacterium]
MRDDALPVAKLLAAAGACAGAIALAVAVVLLILHLRRVPTGGLPVAAPPPLAADQPMLEPAPQPDLASYQAAKRGALHGLGWVDAASGVAHIPIESAMAMRAAAVASGASR